MKIDSVQINNFKSIKNFTLNFDDVNINGIRAGIFVGLNESGKSSLLESISLINKGFHDLDYSNYCNLDEQDNKEFIDLQIKYSVLNQETFKNKLQQTTKFPQIIIDELFIKSITRNVYLDDEGDAGESIEVDFEDLDYTKYFLDENKKNIGGKYFIETTILQKKFSESVTEPIYLDKKKFTSILKNVIFSFIDELYPEILIWRPSEEFLINESIDLNKFKESPEKISVPLKNIFNIYGKKTTAEIKICIDNALKSPAKKDKLVEEISESITKYINKVWKEHKIKIRVSIDATECNVLVEDKDKKYSYFSMEQRSDGFKQFISLILSLSTLNESKSLINKIILIDEPEVHLHPSGIIYMRDELLKIAKNNIVFISSHSQFMIDTDNPNRHFIVNKIKGETKIKQVDNNTNFKEDSVLQNAFGLNLYKELIPKNIIVVEGGDDKYFLNHCLNKFNTIKNFSIKSAGGASKAPGFASLLSNEDLEPIILFDSDKEGKDCKKKILDTYKPFYNNNNVFTLKDILNTLPDNSTIEDLYPIEFVQKQLKDELGKDYNFNPNEPIIIQLKNQEEKVRNDKQKLESIKIKLSNSFVEEYKTKENLESIKKIKDFIGNLTIKIRKET